MFIAKLRERRKRQRLFWDKVGIYSDAYFMAIPEGLAVGIVACTLILSLVAAVLFIIWMPGWWGFIIECLLTLWLSGPTWITNLYDAYVKANKQIKENLVKAHEDVKKELNK